MSKYPEILDAIRKVRAEIRWKPGSFARHLRKRKLRGHLPQTATLVDYEAVIDAVIRERSAQVYRYWYNQVPYVTVVSVLNNQHWLVMFAYNGVLESVFVVEDPDRYLRKPGFEYLGILGEVDDEL